MIMRHYHLDSRREFSLWWEKRACIRVRSRCGRVLWACHVQTFF